MLYLNWAKCIDLLHENGAEAVYFVPIPNERTGGSLYYSDVTFTDKTLTETDAGNMLNALKEKYGDD